MSFFTQTNSSMCSAYASFFKAGLFVKQTLITVHLPQNAAHWCPLAVQYKKYIGCDSKNMVRKDLSFQFSSQHIFSLIPSLLFLLNLFQLNTVLYIINRTTTHATHVGLNSTFCCLANSIYNKCMAGCFM